MTHPQFPNPNHGNPSEPSARTWQESMKLAFRDAFQLLEHLEIAADDLPLAHRAAIQFPVFVPLEYANRMHRGQPTDPLLLQVLPRAEEDRELEGFTTDPVGDLAVESRPGLLHKYPGRVLMIVSGVCAIHCRYCFRRYFPYSHAPKSLSEWEESLRYIEQDSSIQEVILSGGDPLAVVDSTFGSLVRRIERIGHLKRLRIHTRLPVVIPQRITSELCEVLRQTRLSNWFVLHINHPREMDDHLIHAIQQLRKSGTNVLNQTVLLRGINDDIDTLVELSEQLVNHGVQPYYLHQLDRVAGASHFEVAIDRGKELMREIRKRLPGYAVPTYVQEEAGEASKTPIDLSPPNSTHSP